MSITKHKPSQPPDKQSSSREVLPVLVPCEKGDAIDGTANFDQVQIGKHVKKSGGPIRLFRNRDISEAAIKKALSPQDQELLKATLAVKSARERNDSVMPMDAYLKLMVRLGYSTEDKDVAAVFTYPGWATVHVPRLATEAIAGARLVLWFSRSRGKFLPAIYCKDHRTAILVRAFLSFQACPHCGIIFLPEKENIVYCSPKHGHAHRVARMRANQRRKQHGKR
jgi:hypothetical protein